MSEKVLAIQTKISEKKTSKLTSFFRLKAFGKEDRPMETVRLEIEYVWSRTDREKDEVEKVEAYEIPAYQLAAYIQETGKRIP